MRRMLLTTRQHERILALLDIVGRADNSTPEDHDLDLSLRACLAAAPQVAEGSKYLLPLDDAGLALVGVLVSNRLVHLLDKGIDAPMVQAVHDRITALAGIDSRVLGQPSMADLAAPSEGRER